MTITNDRRDDILKHLPDSPGVYLFKDAEGKIIYIGKAQSLRSRVRSYFRESPKEPKTAALVSKVADIEMVVTANQIESLILEANLVREHKPRYNILLRDDKHFPYIKITNEPFPRVLIVRRIDKDGATYFGPYTSAKAMRSTIQFLSRLFQIRTCSLTIPHPEGKPYKVCMDYHIKRCGGPCEGFQTRESYTENIKAVRLALAGRSRQLLDELNGKMRAASVEMQFEDARALKERITALETIRVKQAVDLAERVDQDFVAFAREGQDAVAVVLQIRDGILLGRQDFQLKGHEQDTQIELLHAFLSQYYQHQPNLPDEILIPFQLEESSLFEQWLSEANQTKVRLRLPEGSSNNRLSDMASRNAQLLLDDLLLQRAQQRDRTSGMVTALQQDLHLPNAPRTVVCFDISNTGETDVVGSMSFFENGKPRKGEYRHFKIKSVSGQDDFAMMREIVGRYFHRRREEQKPFPDLTIIDGGKGQLNAALAELASLGIEVPGIISLAKKLEEVFLPNQEWPVNLPKASAGLRLLKLVRDEAHRFGVQYNRKVRSTRTFRSELDTVAGIGPAKRTALLKAFGSTVKIAAASDEELLAIRGITPDLVQKIRAALSVLVSPDRESPSSVA